MICIKRIEVGDLMANCYILFKEKEGIVIDPGDEGDRILEELGKEGVSPRYIINTHGHIDHTGASWELSLATGAKILIHEKEKVYLEDPFLNLKNMLGKGGDPPKVQRFLGAGDLVQVGGMRIKIIHTPGHTPGGICLLVEGEGVVFTGDTLFRGGIGRTDLPGGSYKDLLDSIRRFLLCYDDDVVIYPGHGPSSTIGEERRSNPFLNPLDHDNLYTL